MEDKVTEFKNFYNIKGKLYQDFKLENNDLFIKDGTYKKITKQRGLFKAKSTIKSEFGADFFYKNLCEYTPRIRIENICKFCDEELLEEDYKLICPQCGYIAKMSYTSYGSVNRSSNSLLNYDIWIKNIFGRNKITPELQLVIDQLKKNRLKSINKLKKLLKRKYLKYAPSIYQLINRSSNSDLNYDIWIKNISDRNKITPELQLVIDQAKNTRIKSINKLKKQLKRKHVKYAPSIYHQLTHKNPPHIPAEKLAICRFIFKIVYHSYQKHYKDCISYGYILYKIFDFLTIGDEKKILNYITYPKYSEKFNKKWKHLLVFDDNLRKIFISNST